MPPSIHTTSSASAIRTKVSSSLPSKSTTTTAPPQNATGAVTEKSSVGVKKGTTQVAMQRRRQQKVRTNNSGVEERNGMDGTTTTNTTTASSTELATNDTANNMNDNMMMGMGGGMYGAAGGYGGMSPYYNYGMMGMGSMGMGGMMGGPFSGLNNFLFGVQNVIFSLGQAVQIVGMNTHALQQLYQTAKSMLEHTISTLNQSPLLQHSTSASTMTKTHTEEEEKRRRRIKALRWSLLLSISYTAYRIVNYLIQKKRKVHPHLMTSPSYLQHRDGFTSNLSYQNNSHYYPNPTSMTMGGGPYERHSMYHEPTSYGDGMSNYDNSMGRQYRYNNTRGGRGARGYGYYDDDY